MGLFSWFDAESGKPGVAQAASVKITTLALLLYKVDGPLQEALSKVHPNVTVQSYTVLDDLLKALSTIPYGVVLLDQNLLSGDRPLELVKSLRDTVVSQNIKIYLIAHTMDKTLFVNLLRQKMNGILPASEIVAFLTAICTKNFS